jgi:LysM repeat protein
MKKKFWGSLIVVSLAFQLSACSSSGKKEDPAAEDNATPPAAGDAGTDAVPKAGAEGEQAAGVTTDTPAPGATSEAPSANTPTTTTDYTVQAGDTLMKIAFETYGDVYQWKTILDGNKDKITDAKALKKGMVLKVESPSTPVAVDRNGEKYLIKEGDTLGKISGEVYGSPSKWKQLWENNKQLIHDPNKIFAGFFLYYLANGSGTNLAAGAQSAPATEVSANTPPATSLDQSAGQVAPQEAPSPGKATDLGSMAAAISASAPAASAGTMGDAAPGAEGATQ